MRITRRAWTQAFVAVSLLLVAVPAAGRTAGAPATSLRW